MNAALQARLRFIDFCLDAYGYINRSHLMDYFGLSTPQVSQDIQEYQTVAVGNAQYSASRKRYEKTSTFVRRFP